MDRKHRRRRLPRLFRNIQLQDRRQQLLRPVPHEIPLVRQFAAAPVDFYRIRRIHHIKRVQHGPDFSAHLHIVLGRARLIDPAHEAKNFRCQTVLIRHVRRILFPRVWLHWTDLHHPARVLRMPHRIERHHQTQHRMPHQVHLSNVEITTHRFKIFDIPFDIALSGRIRPAAIPRIVGDQCTFPRQFPEVLQIDDAVGDDNCRTAAARFEIQTNSVVRADVVFGHAFPSYARMRPHHFFNCDLCFNCDTIPS